MTLDLAAGGNGVDLVVAKALQKGVDLRQYKENFLKRRLDIRLKARGIGDYLQYARLLESDPAEFHLLMATFSINVTEFFRDVEFYNAFYSHIIPDMHHRSGRKEVRVWSAGCASGEEPYTIAITFAEAAESLDGFRGKIVATDLSTKAVDTARQGIYDSSRLASLPDELRSKHFARMPDGRYQASDRLKSMIEFGTGNLSTMNTPQQLDAVFCRNVLMYFDKDTQFKILTKFHGSLKDGGYFVLGQSEAVMGESSALFEAVMPKERIYRKR
ncbi:protein-glutamate O-methyltransferase CheR [Nitrososphaera sp.]|uniref:CheR family methyltransferase n=1 Tax=Nitrososphaera sp. TaxID=1971748 RepID=UPI00317AB2D8